MNILVVGAHPDDEVLGLGGTLAKKKKNGDMVFPLICANASQVRYVEAQREKLQLACENSCAELGLQKPDFLGFPDQKLDTFSQIELTQAIEERIKKKRQKVV